LLNVLAFSGNYPHYRANRNFNYPTTDLKWGCLMFGFIGTVLVISQMALLSFGAPTHAALFVGLFAACFWIFHALQRSDKALLITNLIVGMFAVIGLMP